jgi:hypothetical protein
MKRDKRKKIKNREKKRDFLFHCCVVVNKITIQGGTGAPSSSPP